MSELDRLIRFSVVAEEMSFSKAARRLNVDQPWLSRQIQQLEAQMGFPLFVRSTRRVSLTQEGEALFETARELSEAAEKCRRSTRDLVREHSQTLVIGVNPYTFWVPARKLAIDTFQARHPRISIEIVSNYTAPLISMLERRLIDVALVGQPSEHAGLESMVMYSSPVTLLVPKEDPLARHTRIPMDALAGRLIPVTDPKLNQARWDTLYKPFFELGAEPMIVSEGEAAVSFYARDRRLPFLTVGWPHSEQGALADFVHVEFSDNPPQAEYAFVRREEPARGLLSHFWDNAKRHSEMGRTAELHLVDNASADWQISLAKVA